MEFPAILSSLMKDKAKSITALAKDTGISKSVLHGYLNGSEPSLSKIKLLAAYFGVSMDFMCTGEESIDPVAQMLKVDVHKGTYEITVKRLVHKKEK
jgi:transcriptional regulator with XRE-family HTH domain